MVGFDPHENVHLSHVEHALAGAISGSSTRAAFQPLDVLKIRFQLQVEPIKKESRSKYTGISQAFGCIVREEGIRALWKGHIPAQLLSVTYGIAQYASFELLTQEIWNYLPIQLTTDYRPLTHTVCGCVSGCIATTIVHPVDLMRTRFVGQGEPKLYKSLSAAVSTIARKEGMLGFYKGLLPAVSQIGPQMGIQFGLYSVFVGLWNKSQGLWHGAPPAQMESFVCGSVAGFLAKLAVHPLDVVKKRLQIQGFEFEQARREFGAIQRYSGMWNCLHTCLKTEGLSGLYKGLGPSLIKAGLVAGANLCVYEQVCNLLLLYHKRTQL